MGSADWKQKRRAAAENEQLFGAIVQAETEIGPGMPIFEHNQYTFEGEIERLGAFGRGGARAQGWKRVVAVLLVLTFVGPPIAWAIWWLYALLS